MLKMYGNKLFLPQIPSSPESVCFITFVKTLTFLGSL